MNMHKLLKHQLSDFFASHREPSAELLDVFHMISQTYEFYEDKLKRLECARYDEKLSGPSQPGSVNRA